MIPFEGGAARNPMIDSLADMKWHETNPLLNNLIASEANLTIRPLSPGLEADVVKISHGDEHFVLKVWNKHSKPDVLRQYRLLEALHRQGIRVSEPIGCGRTKNGDAVLLTRYHGTAVTKVNPNRLMKMATILADIHQLPPGRLEEGTLARHDFVDYFFSGIEAIPAMKKVLSHLVASADMKKDRIIHGDFNLGNILEENGQYTVIDWTNGQLGDYRYDLAWACLLLRIYLSESKRLTFLNYYHREMPEATRDLEIFEAIACLRWLLLDRIAGVPKSPDTMNRVRKVVRDNPFLNESVLL
jgi:aminoglycoside phosphotransferase (APT) family kinase protein